MVVGQSGVNGGQKQVKVLLVIRVSEESDGGTGTSVTSGLFDSASPNVDYVQSGTGSGAMVDFHLLMVKIS